jgi:hypothetical protein
MLSEEKANHKNILEKFPKQNLMSTKVATDKRHEPSRTAVFEQNKFLTAD